MSFLARLPRSTLPAVRRTGLRYGSTGKPDKSTINIDKKHELDVQSHSAAQAFRDRDAMRNKGTEARGQAADAKKDHPNAPEPVIGMENESGGQVHDLAEGSNAGKKTKTFPAEDGRER